ncbi:TrbI/VirB10 family protein [Erythrobacter aureus]|uniref:TrbI/VirB10 family protein n=1 Tax=Erythrobacter aureus TaxID=2182384 RepID=A0A345YIM4_9SPHN|nr:TrbI/VirB10 family protein [Erythrobacter aureus]AXK43776.1 hypothetical protein DVR09_15075 [Erythrobacter aureus]
MKLTDKQKKTLTISSVVGGGVIALGGLMWVIFASGDSSGSGTTLENNTPTLSSTTNHPGDVSIFPQQIAMTAGPDGVETGTATITAMYHDFNTTSIQMRGDPRLKWESDCIKIGQTLPANESCEVRISYGKSYAAAATDSMIVPQIVVVGNSRTAGGDAKPVEASATIGTALPSGAPVDGVGDMLTSSGEGVDPYGPAPAAPPVDYSQAPAQPVQPSLTPREQFLLARRQAVFSGANPRSAAPHASRRGGGWDELDIPTSTSSMPHDMTRVVTMDRVITAALVRPYDSRSSQQVVAQVDRNVYGGHGRTILIPRGSKLIGIAQGGAERVGISWTQLIRPDGARFVIEAESGDAMGQAGVPGKINNRLLKRYGSILLGTTLNAGVARIFDAEETASDGDLSQPARNNGAIISDIVRADLEKIVNDIVQRNSKVLPIVTVPAGTRITVIPTMDLVLRPASRREVQAMSYPRAQNAGAAAPTYTARDTSGQQQNGSSITFSESAGNYTGGGPNDLPPREAPPTSSTPPWESN